MTVTERPSYAVAGLAAFSGYLSREAGRTVWVDAMRGSIPSWTAGQRTTRNQARQDVFDYIERFYNPRRRHSTLGYLSPMDFEKQAHVA